jgi:signal transduction histidine kinase/DNA-binding response OmpR family regulator
VNRLPHESQSAQRRHEKSPQPEPQLAESFLARAGYALFERVGENEFRAIGPMPDWCAEIWGEAVRPAAAPARLADRSPFLETFLLEAAALWRGEAGESLRSGDWEEVTDAGRSVPLEASAWLIAGRPLLALQNLSSTYADQQRVYQTARDSLLEHERLIREVQKKEILLHCIVHDLTQPLGAMRGAFDLLASEDLPERTARFVEIARGESLRQEQMIRGILEAFSADLASGQSSHAPGAPGTLGAPAAADILDCARQIVRDASPSFESRGLHLALDPAINAASSWLVAGDAPRLLRIFGNLLENAQRYTPRGRSVTIGLEDKGPQILAFVDDEGPGLPAHLASGDPAASGKLFALFAKGKDKPGKAGLGLYFCRITVERWGGTIGAENRAQGGSRFWFRLPRVNAAASAETTAASGGEKTVASARLASDAAASQKREKSRTGKIRAEHTTTPMRILIAEDSEANRELLTELLKKRGHSVTAVPDGREAVSAVARHDFDVLLMDEEMPHLGGIGATRAIRKSEAASGKRLFIVGITGNSTEEDEKRFLAAGMDAFLPKPVRMDRLYEVVESRAHSVAPPSSPRIGGAEAVAPTQSATSEPPSSGANALLDVDVATHLRRTTGGNEALMRSLAKTFLADAPQRFADIRRAISKRNADALAKSAHLLKGGISIFGASASVEAARRLEKLGRDGDLRDAVAAFTTLEAEFAKLRADLLSLSPQPPNSSSASKRSSKSQRKSKSKHSPKSKSASKSRRPAKSKR